MSLVAQVFDQLSLLIRKGFGVDFVGLQAQFGRHGIGDAGHIAGQHVGLNAAAMQFGHQIAAVRSQLICGVEHRRHHPVNSEVNRRR